MARPQNHFLIGLLAAAAYLLSVKNPWKYCIRIQLYLYINIWQSIQQVDGADLRELKVQCSRSGLTVHVKFDGPFYGIVYSQNYYQVPQCTYVTSDNSQGRTSFR
jgi:hypothetical protein